MNSFGDKLEVLETAPRFIDLPDLAQLRRDSGAARPSRDSSVIFLKKRERLESGDFSALALDSRIKRDLVSSFPGFASPAKAGDWPESGAPRDESAPATRSRAEPAESLETAAAQDACPDAGAAEAESVIDHHLTVERRSESTEPDAVSPLPKALHFAEPRFLIKVKRTDSALVLSNAHSDASQLEQSDSELPLHEEMQEERPSNLIFADEPARLRAKTQKVTQYWARSSLLVPNVFRHIRPLEDGRDAYLELQDYSRKELLVQSNGLKFKSASCRDRGAKKSKRGAGGARKTRH